MLDRRGERVAARLGIADPFAGLAADPALVDRQGWNSEHPFLDLAVEIVRPSLVIEVGVWKGMSAIHLARAMETRGLAGEILAVDTWLGAWDHLSDPARHGELRRRDGMPTIYGTFLQNVLDAGQAHYISPVPMDSQGAARALSAIDVTAGVVHIDAAHDFDPCLADLRAYWPLVDENGMLVADDYGHWPSVTRALCTFAAEVDRPLYATMGKAILPKDPTLGFELRVTAQRRYERGPRKA